MHRNFNLYTKFIDKSVDIWCDIRLVISKSEYDPTVTQFIYHASFINCSAIPYDGVNWHFPVISITELRETKICRIFESVSKDDIDFKLDCLSIFPDDVVRHHNNHHSHKEFLYKVIPEETRNLYNNYLEIEENLRKQKNLIENKSTMTNDLIKKYF